MPVPYVFQPQLGEGRGVFPSPKSMKFQLADDSDTEFPLCRSHVYHPVERSPVTSPRMQQMTFDNPGRRDQKRRSAIASDRIRNRIRFLTRSVPYLGPINRRYARGLRGRGTAKQALRTQPPWPGNGKTALPGGALFGYGVDQFLMNSNDFIAVPRNYADVYVRIAVPAASYN